MLIMKIKNKLINFLKKNIFSSIIVNNLKKKFFSLFNKRIKYTFRSWDTNLSSFSEKDKIQYINAVSSGSLDHIFNADKFKNIILCGQPKSASLYVNQLLSFSLNLNSHWIGLDKASGSLYFPRVLELKFLNKNSISHCHCPPDPKTIKILRNLNLKPLILSRNLLDSLVSRRDMLLRDKINYPISFEKFSTSNEEYQIDCIIELFASSYINFYSGWKFLDNRNKEILNPHFITYEQLIKDERGLVESVANFYDLKFDEDKYLKTSNDIKKIGGINFSKGISGRGEYLFNERQKKIIREKASFYSCFDKEFLGC